MRTDVFSFMHSEPLKGKDAFRESTKDWLSVWESIELETDDVEA